MLTCTVATSTCEHSTDLDACRRWLKRVETALKEEEDLGQASLKVALLGGWIDFACRGRVRPSFLVLGLAFLFGFGVARGTAAPPKKKEG